MGDANRGLDMQDCDILVAGSGAAAFATALTAAHFGAKVMMVEKEPEFGGTTAYSAGVIWIPNSSHAIAAGVKDSKEAAFDYLRSKIGNHIDTAKVDAFLDTGPEMLDFLEKHTHAKYSVHPTWADYEPTLPGGSDGGRSLWPHQFDGRKIGDWFPKLRAPLESMMMFGGMMIGRDDLPHMLQATRSAKSAAYMVKILTRQALDRINHKRGTRLANGNALIARLMLSATEAGIPLHVSSPIVRVEQEDGRVTGAWVDLDGKGEQLIKTRMGVVLATGGFPQSEQMKQDFYPHVTAGQSHYSLPPSGNTGDGARIAGEVGGEFINDGEHPAAWAPVSLIPKPDGSHKRFPHFIDRGKPGVIAVLKNGKRFVNEAGSYHKYVPAMMAGCEGQDEIASYLITDHRTIRRYGLGAVGPTPLPLGPHLKSGYLTRADSIGELAAKMGIDPEGLKETVRNHNLHAADGNDPEFGKGTDAYNIFNGDPNHKPNPCLEPIASGPYYSIKLVAGELGTFAGIRTTPDAQVQRADGSVVDGLYAVGNDMMSVMGGTYPGAGITIGPALTFGYIAAKHLLAGSKGQA